MRIEFVNVTMGIIVYFVCLQHAGIKVSNDVQFTHSTWEEMMKSYQWIETQIRNIAKQIKVKRIVMI